MISALLFYLLTFNWYSWYCNNLCFPKKFWRVMFYFILKFSKAKRDILNVTFKVINVNIDVHIDRFNFILYSLPFSNSFSLSNLTSSNNSVSSSFQNTLLIIHFYTLPFISLLKAVLTIQLQTLFYLASFFFSLLKKLNHI